MQGIGPRWSIFAVIGLLGAVAALAVYLYASASASTQAGMLSSPLSLQTTDGQRIDLPGRPALLVFWSPSCAPCLREIPQFNALQAEFAGRGLTILGISTSRDMPLQVVRAMQRHGIQYPVSTDVLNHAARALRLQPVVTPHTFLIDADGAVVWHRQGPADATALRERIRRLLPPPAQAAQVTWNSPYQEWNDVMD